MCIIKYFVNTCVLNILLTIVFNHFQSISGVEGDKPEDTSEKNNSETVEETIADENGNLNIYYIFYSSTGFEIIVSGENEDEAEEEQTEDPVAPETNGTAEAEEAKPQEKEHTQDEPKDEEKDDQHLTLDFEEILPGDVSIFLR